MGDMKMCVLNFIFTYNIHYIQIPRLLYTCIRGLILPVDKLWVVWLSSKKSQDMTRIQK